MCRCCIKDIKFETDHITSSAGGGTIEKSNLQVLCKVCHLIKTSNEHEMLLKAHSIHTQVKELFDSPSSQIHAFVEKGYKIKMPSNFVNLNQDYNRHKLINYSTIILDHRHYFNRYE